QPIESPVGPDERKPRIENPRASPASDQCPSVSSDDPSARSARAPIPRFRSLHFLAVASLTIAADRAGDRLPHPSVTRSRWCERMSDLVKDRLFDVRLVVEHDEIPRERDYSMAIVALPKANFRAIEFERPPTRQAMLAHECLRQIASRFQ